MRNVALATNCNKFNFKFKITKTITEIEIF